MDNFTLTYRQFNQHIENPELVFSLFDTVYGDSSAIRMRWCWEIMQHQESKDIKIFIAEHNGRLVGMTMRMPCILLLQEKQSRAYFASNSMVHPDYRGKGIIGELYSMAAKYGEIQLSKGTAPAMHEVLLKMGYQDVSQTNYQVCILSPVRWFLAKLNKTSTTGPQNAEPFQAAGAFTEIFSFTQDLDGFFHSALSGVGGGVLKNAEYMNWRYISIPHRKYRVFVRIKAEKVISIAVLRIERATAYLVDILWDSTATDEPSETISFLKRTARGSGACKLIAWSSLKTLRHELKRKLFFNSSDSPSFSWFQCDKKDYKYDIANKYFVHGDGDIDYL